MKSVEKPGTPEELAHYGTKGMKWGVRKSYVNRVKKTAARDRRVGEGRASLGEKVKVHSTTTNLRLGQAAKSGRRGFKGAALVRAEKAEQHVARMEAGEAKVGDILRYYGTVRTTDIYRGNINRIRRKAS